MKKKQDTNSNNGHHPKRRRKPIGEGVQALLDARGLNYNDVERITKGEVSHSFLSKLINASPSNPRLDKMIQMADVLEVSLSELVAEETVEPEGIRQSKFWALYLAYQAVKQPKLKAMVDREIEALLDMLDKARWAK